MLKVTSICNADQCTGCSACLNACSHEAIKMRLDDEGFIRPEIDNDRCVGCGLCQRICPVNNSIERNQAPLSIYSGWSKNEEIRLSSASGGAFTELASYFIDHLSGVVFGVAMNEKLEACHIAVESLDELPRLQGSKYIQSNINESYRKAEFYLKNGRNVLFSGTPCQIAGLKSFLRKNYTNLYTADLICHGVPSRRLFNDYIKYLEKELHQQVYDVKFRCKKSSWIFYNMAVNSHVEKNSGKVTYAYEGSYYADPFIRGFLRDNALRPSCYQCQYTSISRVSDFTFADWWGYKAERKEDKNFEKKGVSLIFVNTSRAKKLLPQIQLLLRERTIEEAKKTNLSLSKSFIRPQSRQEFWDDYNRMPFNFMIEKWLSPETLHLSRYFYYKMPPSLSRSIVVKTLRVFETIARKIHLKIITISA